jgi:hypothetical protein
MADLDDLGYTSITDMSEEEAIDLLRQIRLNRRTPKKEIKSKKKEEKEVTSKITSKDANELLKILGGNK